MARYRDKADGMLNCSVAGSGIESAETADFDELTFNQSQGLKQALKK